MARRAPAGPPRLRPGAGAGPGAAQRRRLIRYGQIRQWDDSTGSTGTGGSTNPYGAPGTALMPQRHRWAPRDYALLGVTGRPLCHLCSATAARAHWR